MIFCVFQQTEKKNRFFGCLSDFLKRRFHMCLWGFVVVMWGDPMRKLVVGRKVLRYPEMFYRVKNILSIFKMKKLKRHDSIRNGVRVEGASCIRIDKMCI